jgi:hypothetical protein
MIRKTNQATTTIVTSVTDSNIKAVVVTSHFPHYFTSLIYIARTSLGDWRLLIEWSVPQSGDS